MLMSGAPSFDPIILLNISYRCWKENRKLQNISEKKKTQVTSPHAGKNSLTVVVTMCTNVTVITSPMNPPPRQFFCSSSCKRITNSSVTEPWEAPKLHSSQTDGQLEFC